MKTVGIIAEFNPFHNGHAYLINQAKRETGADHAIIIMSGNYVQRGAPAFMDKFSRTSVALANGADLVIELPTPYSISSAAYFATGAVKMLDKLHIIDYLCFGCETDDAELLTLIADIIINEDECYASTLQSYLKNGVSFAKSRENAIIKSLSLKGTNLAAEEISHILNSPNCILAIEYIKALKQADSNIVPRLIKRTDSGYHSSNLESGYASAGAIRNLYAKKSVLTFNNIRETLSMILPLNCIPLLEESFHVTYPITRNDFGNLIGNSLINDKYKNSNFDQLFDITPDLMNRIRNLSSSFTDVESFINDCNSPSFTSSRIARILFYSLINYTKNDFFTFKANDYVYYYRLLGFRRSHAELLSAIKYNSNYPLISKLSKAEELLDSNGMRMLSINRMADELYRLIVSSKYEYAIPSEEEQGIVITE